MRKGMAANYHLRACYFIGSDCGLIKIGSAWNAHVRLQEIQPMSPRKLEVLAWVRGGEPVEREYHRRFASARLHGEWFNPTPEILAEIARLMEMNAAGPPL